MRGEKVGLRMSLAALGACLGLAIASVPAVVLASTPAAGGGESGGDSTRSRGFVLTDFRAVTPGAGPGDCPDGFNEGYSQRFLNALSPQERKPYQENPRLLQQELAPWYYEDPEKDPCASPENFPDPGMHTIEGELATLRMEPDGSLSERPLPPSQCPAPGDFERQVAQRTLDNQYWRVMGCVRGYQPTGQAAAFANSHIIDGSMTILIEVEELAGESEGAVRVHLYSSDQPVTPGTDGQPLPWASFPVTSEKRFHNRVRGQMKDGVLTTELFDLRLIRAAQRLDSELYLRDARLRLEIDPESGNASGYIGGYWDLEWLAHASIRIQDRTGRSSGKPAADTHGYTCEGKYYAVKRLADGHPDPETGECNSISVLHSLKAVPAFVLPPETGQ